MQKDCTKCGQSKPLTGFAPDKRMSLGVQSHCRECQRNKKREIYRKNAESLRQERLEAYHAKPKSREQLNAKREYDILYRAENAERLYLVKKKWISENADLVREIKRAYKSRRRALIKGGVGARRVAEWVASQEKACHWCGIDCSGGYHIDHYMPLSKGGRHELDNLVISCPTCNLKKNAKLPEEFAARAA